MNWKAKVIPMPDYNKVFDFDCTTISKLEEALTKLISTKHHVPRIGEHVMDYSVTHRYCYEITGVIYDINHGLVIVKLLPTIT